MASVQIGTSLNNPNTSDILIPKNFTLSANATFKGTLNLQNATSVTLPPSERTFINNVNLSSTISSNGVPVGSIAIWYTNVSIPNGWFPCDGTRQLNGVTIPNLRGRFVMCANTKYQVNNYGGFTTKSVEIANYPPHNHGTVTTDYAGNHYHNLTVSRDSDDNGGIVANRGGNANGGSASFSYAGNHEHFSNPATSEAGSGTGFNIIPPYNAMIYIIKLS